VTQLATQVDPDQDRVTLDGKPLVRHAAFRYVLLHKPMGYVVSRHDPENRPIVMDLVPPELKVLFPVGRLDFNTEGALLLTDDGELANLLLHPRYHVFKTYHCWIAGPVASTVLKRLATGVDLDGQITLPAQARIVESDRAAGQTIVELRIREGRNRQLRRMFDAVGVRCKRLVRTECAGVELKNLARGKWRYLTPDEIQKLKEYVTPAAPISEGENA
jgi:23S rRNA pseudouridine2605 synthase